MMGKGRPDHGPELDGLHGVNRGSMGLRANVVDVGGEEAMDGFGLEWCRIIR